MEFSLKTVVVAGLIALTCTCTGLAAPTADTLANDIGHYKGFYTLYSGMPAADYKANWSHVPGWKKVKQTVGRDSLYTTDFYEREYEISGQKVLEKVDVTIEHKREVVYFFGWSLESKSRSVIDEVGSKIQKNLLQVYPRARFLKPWHYTDPTIRRPYFYTTDDGYEKITFYGIIDPKSDKNNPTYRVVTVYSFGVI